MDIQLPHELTDKQIKALRSTLETMIADISIIEKVVGPLLLDANRKKLVPVINFCHDVLQAIRLIPIYARNALKKLPDANGEAQAITEDAGFLLQGLLSTADEALMPQKLHGNNPENLFNIMSEFCLQEGYSALHVEQEVGKIHIRAVKLHKLAVSLRQILATN